MATTIIFHTAFRKMVTIPVQHTVVYVLAARYIFGVFGSPDIDCIICMGLRDLHPDIFFGWQFLWRVLFICITCDVLMCCDWFVTGAVIAVWTWLRQMFI